MRMSTFCSGSPRGSRCSDATKYVSTPAICSRERLALISAAVASLNPSDSPVTSAVRMPARTSEYSLSSVASTLDK